MFDIVKGHVGALNETRSSRYIKRSIYQVTKQFCVTLLPAGGYWFCFTFHWFLTHFVVDKCQIHAWKSNDCKWEMFTGKMEMFPQSIASNRSKLNHMANGWFYISKTLGKSFNTGIAFQCSIDGKYAFSALTETTTNDGNDKSHCINFNYMHEEFRKKDKNRNDQIILIDWLIFIP